jgi:hypothetical protein
MRPGLSGTRWVGLSCRGRLRPMTVERSSMRIGLGALRPTLRQKTQHQIHASKTNPSARRATITQQPQPPRLDPRRDPKVLTWALRGTCSGHVPLATVGGFVRHNLDYRDRLVPCAWRRADDMSPPGRGSRTLTRPVARLSTGGEGRGGHYHDASDHRRFHGGILLVMAPSLSRSLEPRRASTQLTGRWLLWWRTVCGESAGFVRPRLVSKPRRMSRRGSP